VQLAHELISIRRNASSTHCQCHAASAHGCCFHRTTSDTDDSGIDEMNARHEACRHVIQKSTAGLQLIPCLWAACPSCAARFFRHSWPVSLQAVHRDDVRHGGKGLGVRHFTLNPDAFPLRFQCCQDAATAPHACRLTAPRQMPQVSAMLI
jgi:hypothetical protein